MAQDNLSFEWGLKGRLEEQIKAANKDAEHFRETIEKLNVDLTKISADKIQQNITKNVNDAEKALFKLMDAKEKVDKALSRNLSMRSDGFLGMDDSKLLSASARLDEIIMKVMSIGSEASFSRSAVKDLLASLSSDLAFKDAKSATSIMDKGLDKQIKERAKAQKEAAREIAGAFEDADKAAKNNAKNQELVKDALARIATARANLSAASENASIQDQAHARLLMSLLDQLANKLSILKGQFLGEKGVLDGVLGSGYKGLLRNVDVSVKDIVRNAMNRGGMEDAEWQRHKAAAQAAEQHKERLQDLTVAFDRLAKAEAQEAAQQERASARRNNFYQSQQKASQATRQRAEDLVRLRMELLKTQAAELQGLMKKGKGVFSIEQYNEVRDALRGIRNEMRQLEGVMQNLGGYSARTLLGFGQGTQNWSPLITNGNQILAAQQAVRQLSLEEERLIQSIDKASSSLNNQNRVLGDLQNMVQNYISLWGAKDFLNNIIQIGGQLEMQRLSIGAILGDTAHANDLFEKIKALAVQSPFGVVELDQYTKQLSAYGFKYNELYDMTKRLADISAGAGTDVGRLALALGHVRSEAALSGYTLRQFAMNNIPMVGELAKQLTEVEGRLVSVADVRKRVKNKEISYEDVEAVIKKLTDEGGMFYNMQEVVSQSVKARWKNLKDSLDIMYGEMAEAKVGGALKETAIVLTNLSRHWKELFAVLQAGLVVLASYRAMMLINTLLLGKETAAVKLGIKSKLESDAANIKLASSYRTLTAAEQAFTGLRGKSLIVAEALALSERKLTAEGLARQVALGKLTKAEAMQAIALSRLRGEEMLHAQMLVSNVYTYGRFTGIVNGLTIGFQKLGLALKSLVWNPLTAVFAIAGVATELWQKNNEEVERAAELNDSLFNRAVEGIRNIKQMMGETGMYFTLNGREVDFGDLDSLKKGGTFEFAPSSELSTAEMMSTIEKWTQFIKEYSANPNSILNASFTDEAGQVRDLAEQYELLGKAVGETAEAYVWLKQASEAAQFAEDASNGWVDDSFITNINDYAQDVKDYNDAISTSVMKNRQFWSVVLKAARTHTGFAGTLKREGIEAENLSAQIKVLIEDQERYAGAVEKAEDAANNMGRTLSEFGRTNDSYIPIIGYDTSIKDHLDSMRSSYQTMMNDMDTWAEGYKQRLQDSGWVLSDLTEGQKQAIALAIAETVAKANKGTDEIRKEVSRLMHEKMDIPIDADTAKAVAKIAGLKKSLSDLVGQEWTIDIKSASNFDDVISNIRKSYKSAKEFFENTKPLAVKMGIDISGGLKEIGQFQRDTMIRKWKAENPGKDSTMYEDFLDQWDRMAKDMNNAMGFSEKTGISLTDPNKSKNKGDKKDKDLEKAKTRLEEIKSFMSEYKKYKEVYGKEKAVSMLEDFFPTTKGKGKQIVNDYKQALADILKDLGKLNTEERKKFGLSIDKLTAEYNLTDDKENIDFALKELQEYISKRTSNWNLYKQLLEKTGDRDFAKNAFANTRIFDDAARELEAKLRKVSDKPIDYGMTQVAAEKYYEDNKEAYELWKKIVELTTQNWTDGLSKGADAYAQLLTVSEKIKKNEEEIAKLRKEGAGVPGNEARIRALQKDNEKLSYEQFQQGSSYLRFFGSVLTMANSEVENTAQTIKQRLIKELANGTISAHQYTKSLKEVDDQLSKSRTAFKGVIGTFLQGGQKGVVDYRQEEVQNAAIELEQIRKKREELEKVADTEDKSNRINLGVLKIEEEQAKERLRLAAEALGISVQAYTTLNKISIALAAFTGFFDGVQKAMSSLSQMYEALGKTDLANDFSDMADAAAAIGSVLTPANNIIKSAMNGDVSGIISNAITAPVDMIAGPITAFAKLHDKQLQREIDASKERQKELDNLTNNLEKVLERTLGGVYSAKASKEDLEELRKYRKKYIIANTGGNSFAETSLQSLFGYIGNDTFDAINKALETESYYDTKLAELMLQRDELNKQLSATEDKKGDHASEIADYKQQIKELDDQIKNFALDMAKNLYDIDVKSWAKELTDAIVGAWEKGENAAEAYKNKVKDIMKTLTTNILSQKVMEKALEKVHLDDIITKAMVDTSGQLNESVVEEIANALFTAGEDSANIITKVLDAMETKGYIQKGDGSSSTTSKVIQGGFTENETGLLLSYVNGMRADLSVQRLDVNAIMLSVQQIASRGNFLTQAQERNLEAIAANTLRNADAADQIFSLLHRATQDKAFGFKIQ